MSGFQFVHVRQYSRKPVAPDAKGKGGRSGLVDVLSEAARLPGHAPHVLASLPPVQVFGVPIADVQALHDARCDEARTQVEGGKPRKIRQDQATLMTSIASYPATVAECAADPAKAAACDDWQRRTVEWARSCWGDDVVSVVRHDDESHPHLHVLMLPADSAMRANALHPGWVAKQAAKTQAAAEGLDAKTVNKLGDRAYVQAMREFQDGYWQAVGLPCGLARIGPAKRSLPRPEWRAEQNHAAHVGALVRAAEAASSQLAHVSQVVEGAAERQAKAEAAEQRARHAVAEARRMAIAAREAADAAEARRIEEERRAQQLVAKAHTVVARARHSAGEIVIAAAAEAEATRRRSSGIGARIGTMLSGVLDAVLMRSPKSVDERARADEREKMRPELERISEERDHVAGELRRVEGRAKALAASVSGLGQQRDEARTALNFFRDKFSIGPASHQTPL